MAKKIKTPVVCKLLLNDHVTIVTRQLGDKLNILEVEDNGPLTLNQIGLTWWGVHLFETKEDPKVIAEIFKEYASNCGAYREAASELGRIIKLSAKEIDAMATTAKPKKSATKTTKRKANKEDVPSKELVDKEAARKAKNLEKLKKLNAEKKAKRDAEGPKERKPSASSRFKELIMAGKLTDDEIFAQVQEEFGLDDSRRNYVSWYRSKLKKDGQNPPAAKK